MCMTLKSNREGGFIIRGISHHPVITFQQVVKQTHVTEFEARELMGFLANVEIIGALSCDEWGWGSAIQDYVSLPSGAERLISMEAWVHEKAHDGGVTAAEVAYKYGMERHEVTALLRRLRGQGLVRIDPLGLQRGQILVGFLRAMAGPAAPSC